MISKKSLKKQFKEYIPMILVIIGSNVLIGFLEKYEALLYGVIIAFIVSLSYLVRYFYNEKKKLKLEKDKVLQLILEYENSNYFVYRGRKKNRNFIEEKMLNQLENIKIVFKKDSYQDYQNYQDDFEKYIFKVLYKQNIEDGYPFLVKVRNGQIEVRSINVLVNEVMNGKKSSEFMFKEIREFYAIVE